MTDPAFQPTEPMHEAARVAINEHWTRHDHYPDVNEEVSLALYAAWPLVLEELRRVLDDAGLAEIEDSTGLHAPAPVADYLCGEQVTA